VEPFKNKRSIFPNEDSSMSTVRVRYVAQLKLAAGCGEESITIAAAPTLHDLLRVLSESRGEPLRAFLLTEDGSPRTSLLIAVGDQQAVRGTNRSLVPGDVVTLMSPMSGG